MPSISILTTSPTFKRPPGLAHGAYSGRSAGGDHVARLEREGLGEVRDLLEAVEHHLLRIPVLALFVVDESSDAEIVRIAQLVS